MEGAETDLTYFDSFFKFSIQLHFNFIFGHCLVKCRNKTYLDGKKKTKKSYRYSYLCIEVWTGSLFKESESRGITTVG